MSLPRVALLAAAAAAATCLAAPHPASAASLPAASLPAAGASVAAAGASYPGSAASLAASAAASCRGGVPSDFDGDGRADLAVAAPYTTVDGNARAGSVRVLYGMSRTVDIDQGTPGVADEPETADAFGSALAAGDFDGDGCTDLAVGASEESAGARTPGADGNGVVHVFRGTPSGLRPDRTIDITDFGGERGADRFGAALAAGDLDGDGKDELVVGAPGHGKGGAVAVDGMKGRKPYLLTQGTSWIGQEARVTDEFGDTLAAGDFDGDGDDEIVAGAPGDTVTKDAQGSATVIDPRSRRATRFTQDTPGVSAKGEAWDYFGSALATGDFDADGRDDLAVGVPGEGLTGNQRAMDYGDGTVHAFYGSRGGLTAARAESWSQNSLDGRPRYYDRFGAALAAADLNGDGDAELAVGVPGENAVQVLAGTRSGGLTKLNNVLVTGKDGDFGAAVAPIPAAKGSAGDLVVASPGTGRLTVVRGGLRSASTGAFPGVRASRTQPLPAGPAQSLYGYALAP